MMTTEDQNPLAMLGITREEVLDRAAEKIIYRESDDQEAYVLDGILDRIKERVDEKVQAVCDAHVLTNVDAYIATLVLQPTNAYGEAKGEPRTFNEYLVARAEAYLRELVDYQGNKPDRYGTKAQSRITHLIDNHLHYEIKTALEQSLALVVESVAGGLEDTVKLKLAEIQQRLKIEVKK